MSRNETEKPVGAARPTARSRQASQEDPFADTRPLIAHEIPQGVDRRSFLMRTAVGGAAAVMTGCSPSPAEKTAKAAETVPPAQAAPATPSAPPLSPDLNVVKKEKGPVLTTVDEFYKVGPGPSSSHTIGPMRITYDFYQRADQTAGRQARHGDEASGEPVRQPQRHRQGTRHGARRARRTGRERTGHRRPEVPRQPARQARPGVPGEARRQVHRREPQGRHLRRHQGRLQAPEHDDGQAPRRQRGAARAGVLLGGRRIHRVEGLHAAEEERAEIPVRDDEGAAGPRRHQQDHDRQDHAGQRDVDLGQERRGGLRLHRQDHQRDGRDGEVGAVDAGRRRAARSDQAAQQGGDRLQARHGRQVSSRTAASARSRRLRWRRPKKTGAATS